jgi:hypothetical protein
MDGFRVLKVQAEVLPEEAGEPAGEAEAPEAEKPGEAEETDNAGEAEAAGGESPA